jgi:hypothetical protein
LHRDRFGGASFADVATPGSELVDRGLYAKHLDVVYGYFKPDRVKILIYDDLEAAPGRFVAELYRYVGVDEAYRPPSLATRYNRVVYPRLQRTLLGLKLGWVIDAVKTTALGDRIRGHHSGARRDAGVATQEELRHLRGHFIDDVRRLEQRLGRDLSQWLRL